MNMQPPSGPIAWLAQRPLPVLLGLIAGFLACCGAGRLAARQQPFANFVRFYPEISQVSHLYPPFSQVLNLARERIRPGKVLVIVGGNSVMNGVGQRESEVWTFRLQELLGERFTVLNLALRGNDPCEFGGLVAECLIDEGAEVVFVTGGLDALANVCVRGSWDGPVYRTFFWDAWGKELLPRDEERDHWLADDFYHENPTGSLGRELRSGGCINGAVYASDLWNTIAYRYISTVWCPLKYPWFMRPHIWMPDVEPGDTLPFETHHREELVPLELERIRRRLHSPRNELLLHGGGENIVVGDYNKCLPALLRDRTLFVHKLDGLYFRERLSPEEQRRCLAISQCVIEFLNRNGLHAQLVSQDYTVRDYADRAHFSESGGRKLAADLAPTIRSLAFELYGPPKTSDGDEQ
jgi:hypothetical protein